MSSRSCRWGPRPWTRRCTWPNAWPRASLASSRSPSISTRKPPRQPGAGRSREGAGGAIRGIREAIATDPARAPDFGPARVHPTAGAVAIGARPILIAYNAYLTTPDVAIAKKIAKAVRARDGGLPEVKALGFEIAERHRAQVSMNLTDYRTDADPPRARGGAA